MTRIDLDIDAADIVGKLSKALLEQLASFTLTPTGSDSQHEKNDRIALLDATQLVIHDVVEDWSKRRVAWREFGRWTQPPPSLRLLLLGTAGTGKTHTVKEFLKLAFEHVNKDYRNYIKIDEKFFRPNDNIILKADYQKAKKILKWKPKISFRSLAVSYTHLTLPTIYSV